MLSYERFQDCVHPSYFHFLSTIVRLHPVCQGEAVGVDGETDVWALVDDDDGSVDEEEPVGVVVD